MVTWKDYQEQTAAFFRGLDMIVNTDERLTGVRGTHDVDVVIRRSTAGIEQLWIVECKKWKRRVTKLHVVALAEIVRDVGADRGILLSESGFQAGAVRMARSSNITLSSVSDLEDNSEDERVELGLQVLRKRLARLNDRVGVLMVREPTSGNYNMVPGADWGRICFLYSLIESIDAALSAAEVGRWPVTYYENMMDERRRAAQTGSELIAGLSSPFAELQNALIEQEISVRSAGGPSTGSGAA